MPKMVRVRAVCMIAELVLLLCRYTSVEGVIVQPPKTQVILPGTNATFSCITSGLGTSQWTVNRMPYDKGWLSRGIASNIEESLDPNTGITMTLLTLIMNGLAINNGSEITCYYGYATVETSPPASLIIAGPPLAPKPTLSLLNETVLQISWEKPFTWTEVADIINYTVSMYNSSNQERKNWTVNPLMNSISVVTNGGVAQECVELLFEVSANNVVGESQVSSISGGFPTAMKWFDQNGTSRFTLSIHYNKDGSVLVVVKVKPPIMCRYQDAKYDVIITDFAAGLQKAKQSLTHTYGDGESFDIAISFVPTSREERTYYIILSVSSFNFPSLQTIASFNISPSILPSTFNNTSGSENYVLIIGAAAGGSSIIVLIILIAIFLTIWCKLHAGKSREEQGVTEHHYQDTPVVPSRSFEHAIPSDPVYERIDDCRDQTVTNEKSPEGEIIEPENSVDEKCATEYVRHTPDGDYIEMKMVAESAENGSCGEVHTPLPGGPFQETL